MTRVSRRRPQAARCGRPPRLRRSLLARHRRLWRAGVQGCGRAGPSAQPSAVVAARRLPCGARSRGPSQNSLRELRSLRSDNCAESVYEARIRARPQALCSSAPPIRSRTHPPAALRAAAVRVRWLEKHHRCQDTRAVSRRGAWAPASSAVQRGAVRRLGGGPARRLYAAARSGPMRSHRSRPLGASSAAHPRRRRGRRRLSPGGIPPSGPAPHVPQRTLPTSATGRKPASRSDCSDVSFQAPQ